MSVIFQVVFFASDNGAHNEGYVTVHDVTCTYKVIIEVMITSSLRAQVLWEVSRGVCTREGLGHHY